jgi:hypothetical protein
MKPFPKTVLSALILVCLLFSITSNATDNSDSGRPPASQSTTNMTLRLYAVNERYDAAEAVDLILILRNSSDRPRVLWEEMADMDFLLTVKDQDGESVPSTRYGEWVSKLRRSTVHNARNVGISSHEERLYSIRLNRLFDLTTIGRYTISARRKVRVGDGEQTLTSNELTVAIVDPRISGS